MKDDLSSRMKSYEEDPRFLPLLPVVARIDGKCFSNFTRKLNKPFDDRFGELMCATTRFLVQETCACIGYTQSDEITLVFYSPVHRSQIFMDGRKRKVISILASMTTAFFNFYLKVHIPEKANELAFFDARADAYPTKEEAVNALVWREMDATRNSIEAAARSILSHKQMHKKNCSELMEYMFQSGINWNDYPVHFKRGTYFQRKTIVRAFDIDEICKLPEKHEARRNPDLVVTRHDVVSIEAPPILKITNRVAFVFEGAVPITEADSVQYTNYVDNISITG